jgi:hypothetical protein
MSSRPALGSTQPPIHWVPGALSPWVKRPSREADHSAPTSAEVKKSGSIHPLPYAPSWQGAYLRYLSTGTTISNVNKVELENSVCKVLITVYGCEHDGHYCPRWLQADQIKGESETDQQSANFNSLFATDDHMRPSTSQVKLCYIKRGYDVLG